MSAPSVPDSAPLSPELRFLAFLVVILALLLLGGWAGSKLTGGALVAVLCIIGVLLVFALAFLFCPSSRVPDIFKNFTDMLGKVGVAMAGAWAKVSRRGNG